MSLLCCVFDSFYPSGAVVCWGPITVTNCHTVSNIQLLTYLSGKCASSNSSTNLWVLRETRSCLDVIPEAVLFCFGSSPVCFEVSLFHTPPAPSSSTLCISAAWEHKGLFGGWNSSSWLLQAQMSLILILNYWSVLEELCASSPRFTLVFTEFAGNPLKRISQSETFPTWKFCLKILLKHLLLGLLEYQSQFLTVAFLDMVSQVVLQSCNLKSCWKPGNLLIDERCSLRAFWGRQCKEEVWRDLAGAVSQRVSPGEAGSTQTVLPVCRMLWFVRT